MESFWGANISKAEFKNSESNMQADVAIVGGGISGILIAYELSRRGIDYVLLEKNSILSGVTKNTTAKITSAHGFIYNKLLSSFGAEYAKLYYKANEEAIKSYKRLSKEYSCDFKEASNYVYSLDDKSLLEKELDALTKANIPFSSTTDLEIPIKAIGAVKFKNQAQFNPLMLLYQLAEKLNIYENTFVQEIKDKTIITDRGTVQAEKIIIATHFPIINTHGLYPLKLYQDRSYVIALDNAQRLEGMYIDGSAKGLSFRSYKDYLLLGGGAHRTGKGGCGWQQLRGFASKSYPHSKEVFHWATQDCIALDGVAYIGNYSKSTPELFVATGFNKWGMTTSMVASKILADMISGKENEYIELFNPSRNMITPQLLINGFEAITNLVNPIPKRCTHLGCALKWNKYEHTYDCACHGSRFDKKGRVINNPAQKNLK